MYLVIEMGLNGFVVYMYEDWACIKHALSLSHIFTLQYR